jgi:hypothetical protein
MEFQLTYANPPRIFDQKIELVKDFKFLLNLGLKDAKDFIDGLQESGTARFNIEGDELPHATVILLHKNNITFKEYIYPNIDNPAPTQNNIIRLNKFSGDILQEMDLKSYLYKQFRLNYLDAAELIEQLKKGESKMFDINPAEKDFISGVFERYGVAHDFGAAQKSTSSIDEMAKKFQYMNADISLRLSNNPDITVSKLHLVKVLRQYNTENWDLSKSKDKAEEMLDKGKIMVKVHSSNFMAFSAEIKQLNLYLETYNL